MATGRCPGSGALPQLSRGVPYISAALARPSLAAWEAAAWRVGAPSFPSTAETRWSIVLAEMKAFAPISALAYPAQTSASTSRSRRVRPSGCSGVASRWPAGIEQMSSRRSAPRMMPAVAAPRSWQMSMAWRRQAPVPDRGQRVLLPQRRLD
jgi:hypothetical protein